MAQTVWTDPRSASFAICAAILGTYWILSSITLVVDVTRRCRANKFQPEKWPDYVMLTDVIGHVLLQQAFLIVPTFYFLGPTIMSTFFSLSPELPSFQRLLFDLVSFVIGAEVWFYYTHRLFHHPSLYGPIHKWCVVLPIHFVVGSVLLIAACLNVWFEQVTLVARASA